MFSSGYMKKIIFLLVVLVILMGCTKNSLSNGLEVCIDQETGNQMDVATARIAAVDSECSKEGYVTVDSFCNENTGTLWFNLELEKEGCNPACVVDVNTGQAEINWRCTGLIN